MPTTLSRIEVKRLALSGAQSRLDALNAEVASIVRAFPELKAEIPFPKGQKARKRRTMSAAARKRMSDAQKARWAKQKGKGKKR